MTEIKFYRVNDAYGYLSNFAPYPFEINGLIWSTSEHYFQAQKFLDKAIQEKIRRLKSPMDAALEGRNRENPLRSDWEVVKDDIMRLAVFEKFCQNPAIRRELLATGHATLIEHTKNDNYWADNGDGTGKNMLGIILMETRKRLKAE
ncbi:NADAR family protein [Streptococcus sp. CCH8-C6]|uniref:NADAR family protein n=1 Tax=Streptococcus sp. CCH8-C6 TaxID=1768777 RepID=UPI00076A3667|nr:NADAR family protein [Streptococcus sp. CCH8-C6]